MENEIKIGEYCRTKDGYISQVTEIDHYIWFNSIIYKESGIGCYGLSRVEFENLVVKHSHNLKDILKCGDYVNGYKVEKIDNGLIYCCESNGYYEEIIWKEKDIKSIVTKEKFESISYKVKE